MNRKILQSCLLICSVLYISDLPAQKHQLKCRFVQTQILEAEEDIGSCIASGDIDGDSDIDLVMMNFGDIDFPESGGLTIFRNGGQADFSLETINTPLGVHPCLPTLIDVDADLDLDIVCIVFFLSVGVFLNDGTGDFTFFQSTPFPPTEVLVPFEIQQADFDSDGDTDVMFNGFDFGPLIPWASFFANNRKGNFTHIQPQYFPISGGQTASVADVDGDLDPDVAITGPNFPFDSVDIFENNGSASFAIRVIDTGQTSMTKLSDIDNNSAPDLVVASSGESVVGTLLNEGDGTFGPRVDYPIAGRPNEIAAVDLENDGDSDLLAFGRTDQFIAILFNDGTANFPIQQTISFADFVEAELGDFDGDSDLDLAVAFSSNTSDVRQVAIFINQCGFLGDVDGDGIIDLSDVAPFIERLTAGEYQLEADVNCDGALNLTDVAPFVDLLVGG